MLPRTEPVRWSSAERGAAHRRDAGRLAAEPSAAVEVDGLRPYRPGHPGLAHPLGGAGPRGRAAGASAAGRRRHAGRWWCSTRAATARASSSTPPFARPRRWRSSWPAHGGCGLLLPGERRPLDDRARSRRLARGARAAGAGRGRRGRAAPALAGRRAARARVLRRRAAGRSAARQRLRGGCDGAACSCCPQALRAAHVHAAELRGHRLPRVLARGALARLSAGASAIAGAPRAVRHSPPWCRPCARRARAAARRRPRAPGAPAGGVLGARPLRRAALGDAAQPGAGVAAAGAAGLASLVVAVATAARDRARRRCSRGGDRCAAGVFACRGVPFAGSRHVRIGVTANGIGEGCRRSRARSSPTTASTSGCAR